MLWDLEVKVGKKMFTKKSHQLFNGTQQRQDIKSIELTQLLACKLKIQLIKY